MKNFISAKNIGKTITKNCLIYKILIHIMAYISDNIISEINKI